MLRILHRECEVDRQPLSVSTSDALNLGILLGGVNVSNNRNSAKFQIDAKDLHRILKISVKQVMELYKARDLDV